MTQPRTLVVGSVHLKLWWLNMVKVKRRPGPTIRAPQELVYDKNMHHAHNCSVARFNPKGSGNQNRTGRVRNRKAQPNFQVPKQATSFFWGGCLSTPTFDHGTCSAKINPALQPTEGSRVPGFPRSRNPALRGLHPWCTSPTSRDWNPTSTAVGNLDHYFSPTIAI